MRPYYEDSASGITIYHGDCREILPTLDAVDVTLTDPPYGIGKADWDDVFPVWWMPEVGRLSLRMGLMPGVWNVLRCPADVGRLQYRWVLAAHLSNGMTRGRLGFGNWIPCLIYTSRQESAVWCARFADWCEANGVTKADLNRATGTSDMGGWWASRLAHRAQVPSVGQWETLKAAFHPPVEFDEGVETASWYEPSGDCRSFAIGREPKPEHPSPKPMSVVQWFLSRLGGASVLDPFMGSGTTLLAAKNLGRRAIGIEIEERYCEIAARRLDQGVLDLGGAA